MAYDLAGINTKVQQRIRDTGYSWTEVTNYVNDTQNDIFNEYRLPFMKATQAYTVTIGVADITNGSALPTNFDLAIDLIDTTSGQEQTIPYIDMDELDRLYNDPLDTTLNPNGKPLYWYFDGVTMKLFPAPAGAYTLTLRYYKKPTLLVNNADVPSVPINFEEILVEGAAYRILQVKDNYDQAAIHKNHYDELLQKLVVRYSNPQFGRPSTMRINRRQFLKPSSTRWR